MIKRLISLSLAIVLSAALMGCSSGGAPSQESNVPGGNTVDRTVFLNDSGSVLPIAVYPASSMSIEGEYDAAYTAVNNAFAIKMLKATEDKGTCVFSPLSLQIALQVLANGGDEATSAALLESICPGLTRADVNVFSARLLEKLLSSQGVNISTAVVANDAYRICTEFADTAANYYKSSVGALDFSNPGKALEEINDWVKDNTDGLIDKLLESLLPNTAMVILNALTLKLDWTKPFNVLREASEFNGASKVSNVTMIKSVNEFGYGSFDEGQIASIPYAGDEYAMAVILPAKGYSPSEAASALIGRIGECKSAVVSVTMPKIDLENKLDILSMAEKLGIDKGVGGVFTKLIDSESATVTTIVHGSMLSVTEYGTTAAAATAIVTTKGVPFFSGEYELVCDRPYAMVIYNIETGAVLFCATVNDIG